MPIVKCKICNTEFYVKPSHISLGYGKYCSVRCRSKSQEKGKFVKCAVCSKDAWKMPKDLKRAKSGKSFCSVSCQTKWRNSLFSGEKHSFWKGGRTIYRKILMQSNASVVCRRCGIKDVRVLAVHHIDKNRKNNNLENLTWLCHNCHYLVHHDKIEFIDFNRRMVSK
jgi:hypothetical protein